MDKLIAPFKVGDLEHWKPRHKRQQPRLVGTNTAKKSKVGDLAQRLSRPTIKKFRPYVKFPKIIRSAHTPSAALRDIYWGKVAKIDSGDGVESLVAIT
ncbi:MAG: hypothetical protein NC210_06380 [[Clostridium] fimetarium]|nr:hypothetical protein [Alistipes timonensis]MCM1406029.1 hypothetical protein [[Clostridium] fimetarium]